MAAQTSAQVENIVLKLAPDLNIAIQQFNE